MKEWMDLYDCQGRVKGLTHTTTQAPQDGNFYLATRIWVRDAAGAFLFLRCADTDSWTPGQWTVPGDFVAAGVQGQDAARQTLQTQTGLTPTDAQWQSLGASAIGTATTASPITPSHSSTWYSCPTPLRRMWCWVKRSKHGSGFPQRT